MRHEDIGLITEREIRLTRLLAPHVRRAVTICDLMDMKSLETGPLTDILDAFAAGVVLVAGDATIIHANRVAADMLAGSGPIFSTRGRLRTADARSTAKLRHIVAASARREADIGADGIGMALSKPNGDVATAHVLPLANGDLRTRLEPNAAAAVFVGSREIPSVSHIGGFAEAFGLSPAEARVLARLVLGELTDEAARALGIAVPTVKTHLSRILGKTGSRRQTDLLTLVHRLAPSVNVDGRTAAF